MKRVCRVCGKEFEGHWASTLCSKECKVKRRKEINQDYNEHQKGVHYSTERKNKKAPLEDHIAEAKRQGVSYGYYMAMLDGRL